METKKVAEVLPPKVETKKYSNMISLFFVLVLLIVIGAFLFSFVKKDSTDNPGDDSSEQDNTALEVSVPSEALDLLEGSATILVKSNKEIELVEAKNRKLIFSEDKNSEKLYVLEATGLGIGEGVVKFSVKDKAGAIIDLEIPYKRTGFKVMGKDQIDPWPDSGYVADGNDLLAPVSKSKRLLNTYAPTDLVELKPLQLYTQIDGMTLRQEAAENLRTMLFKMKAETSKDVLIASSYRSYNTQIKTYSSYLVNNTQAEVDRFSARPGYSEHQLGTAIDFQSSESGFDFLPEFDDSTQGKWLKENSYKFGFVQPYPKDKESVTGYTYEAWHYRYIGIENATELKESGLTLTEWLKQP